MKMLLKKLGQLSSEYLDRFSGADEPTLYYLQMVFFQDSLNAYRSCNKNIVLRRG